jgi:starch synthase (maltosyl-transferring)
VRVGRHKELYSTWYELFPRSAANKAGVHGTFKDVEKLLPRVAEMGFDVLYMPPIHPVGKVNRKGKNNAVSAQEGEPGSPWAIGSDEGGHKAVHSELGTLKDYKNLIKEANKLGIEIALDLAFQCAPDHPYIKEHPEWFIWRPDGTIMYAENPPKKYQDIVPLNFESDDWQALWEELKSVILFWVEAGIHIFRVDNPHTKPFRFWEWAIAETHKVNPDVIFLSEAFSRPKIMAGLAKAGFTQSYSYFTWRNTRSEMEAYLTELTQTNSREYFRPNFWPNTPDILPYELMGAGENQFIKRLILAATLSSSYGMYGPAYEFMENTGNTNGKEEYHNSEKYETRYYDWNKRNKITDVITKINKIRKENPALQSTWNINFTRSGNEQIISYIKATEDLNNIIWCIINFDPNETQYGNVEVPKWVLNIEGPVKLRLTDLLTNEVYYWKKEVNFVKLDPSIYPGHIFKVEVLTETIHQG